MLGIGSNGLESLGAGVEQELVDESLVLQRDAVELFGDGEHYVEVLDGQQFAPAPLDPVGPLAVLAFRAMER